MQTAIWFNREKDDGIFSINKLAREKQ